MTDAMVNAPRSAEFASAYAWAAEAQTVPQAAKTMAIGCRFDALRVLFPSEYRVRLASQLAVSPVPCAPASLLGLAVVPAGTVPVIDPVLARRHVGVPGLRSVVRAVVLDAVHTRLACLIDGELEPVQLLDELVSAETCPEPALRPACLHGRYDVQGVLWWVLDPALLARLVTNAAESSHLG